MRIPMKNVTFHVQLYLVFFDSGPYTNLLRIMRDSLLFDSLFAAFKFFWLLLLSQAQ